MSDVFEQQKDWDRLYRQAQRLIETMPKLEYSTRDQRDVQEWLGKAYALVDDVHVGVDNLRFTTAVSSLATANWQIAAHDIQSTVFRAAAVAESKAPEGAAGVFLNVGAHFDAFSSMAKVFGTATSDVLLIDAYMDHTALTDFAVSVPDGIRLRLLADEGSVKATLKPAMEKWQQQYGAKRPLEVRLALRFSLHDRAIFVDGTKVWLISQSLNKIVARSPATVTPADNEVAVAKIAAYEAIWKASKAI